jgi:hypothetical protein
VYFATRPIRSNSSQERYRKRRHSQLDWTEKRGADTRNIHLNGAAAELILGTGGELLAEQPTPVPVTLVAGKAV